MSRKIFLFFMLFGAAAVVVRCTGKQETTSNLLGGSSYGGIQQIQPCVTEVLRSQPLFRIYVCPGQASVQFQILDKGQEWSRTFDLYQTTNDNVANEIAEHVRQYITFYLETYGPPDPLD